MATVVRCDKCGNMGDGRFFAKAIVYPPQVASPDSPQQIQLGTRNVARDSIDLDICTECYKKFTVPAPFQITATGETKWEGEQTP